MRTIILRRVLLAVALCAALSASRAKAQSFGTDALPDDTQFGRAGGQNVQPFYEGWQRLPDGHIVMWFGYLNRNFQEQLDVPIGENNKFDLQPDLGQPTHFYPRRSLFVFKVPLPDGWPADKRLNWTVTAHGKPSQASGWLQPEWEVDEGVIQMNIGPGSAPPDPPNSAPKITVNADTSAIVGKPLKLTASATDDGIPKPRRRPPSANAATAAAPMPLPPAAVLKPRALLGLRVRWILYRGPDSGGAAAFDQDSSKATVGATTSDLTTDVTFSTPGTYWLRAIATDGLLETPYDLKVNVISGQPRN
jgi:hypothetical protein